MSDNDSSDDEINAQLLSAVDTSLLSDDLYKPSSKGNDSTKHVEVVKPSSVPSIVKDPVPKSNRYLTEEESIFHSDLNVPATMQKVLAEKLSRVISNVIEFDEIESDKQSLEPNGSIEDTGVRILAGFDEFIDINLDHTCSTTVNTKKIPVVRRTVDKEAKVTGADKIAASVCDPGSFPKEVQQWKGPRKRSIEFPYKQKKSGIIEEKSDPFANEFRKARNANMWHESKIRKFKKEFPKTTK
uniref:Uncharacterized protein n=1 Tax=Anopheles christyi TaxID=43041 RepID=A0A182KIB5_9DIPT